MTEHYVDVRYSDDGGKNWSNWRTVDLGTVGSFAQPCVLRRLGTTRARIWQWRDTSPFQADCVAASVDAST